MGVRAHTNTSLEWLVNRLRIGGLGGRPPLRKPDRLVFVCTGNICRSVYAEAVARSLGLEAVSAGIVTTPGLPANPQAIVEARARGLDLSSHRTRAWSDLELRQGDLVLPAQLHHLLVVRRRVLEEGCPAVLMSHFSGDRFAVVRDPYGQDATVFREVFDLIDRVVHNMNRAWGGA
jgi:protein-tyrosine phosphatase